MRDPDDDDLQFVDERTARRVRFMRDHKWALRAWGAVAGTVIGIVVTLIARAVG